MNFAGPFDAKSLTDSPVSLDSGGFSFGAKPGFVQHHTSDAHVVIPDSHLLFSGNYVRIGSDLIISNADHKIVVGNYFKGESRPTLTSSDGATLSGQIVDALTGHVHYAQATAPAASQVIGHVLKMSGSASAIRNGVSIELHIGDAVQKGDVVQTGSDSSVGMTFVDGSAFGMTSNARMVLNEMIYDPNGSSNSSLISLVQGTITFVAGQTAKNGNMRVETPVATMGIRGTAVLVEIAANDGPTKFSVLAEPDGHTGSFNLYDKTTGQLIGTVSQAGQVTFVSVGGIGQPPTAVEQLKTLQDQEQAKAIINQVFQLYFPNFNPDNSNPKTQKFGSSSVNNLADIVFTTTTTNQQTFLNQIELRFAVTDPLTGAVTYQNRIFYNTKAVFTADSVTAEQSFVSSVKTFKISDVVHIDDPDIGNGPFFDVATPFVAGSAIIKSAVSSNPNLDANFLSQFLHINQQTGEVTFDRLGFNFLGKNETATFMLQVTSRSGPDTATVIIPIIVTGDNDVPNGPPTIVVGPGTVVTGIVKEDAVPVTASLATDGTITFRDFDLTDTHTVTHEFTSSSSTLPGFTTGQHLGTFTIALDPENTTDTVDTGTVQWHFSLPDNDPTLQSLAEGQTIKQVYTITIKDIYGAEVKQDVTITITGTNDVPVFTSDLVGAVTETSGTPLNSTPLTDSGIITFTDVDLSDTHAVSATGTFVAANPGDVALGELTAVRDSDTTNGTGGQITWTYSVDPAKVEYLAQGETLTETFTITIGDGTTGGAPIVKTIEVIITGTNDAPVITSSTSAATVTVAELLDITGSSALDQAGGTVTFGDADLTDTHQITQSAVNFAWSGGQLSQPQIDALIAASTRTLTSNDSTGTGSGSADWTFKITDGALDFLAVGQTLTVTYDITVADYHNESPMGTSAVQQVTVTFTGSNDAPTLQDIVAGALHDTSAPDTFGELTGVLAGHDVDNGDTLNYYVLDQNGSAVHGPVTGLYGTLTVNSNGSYTYVPNDAAINALRGGQDRTDVFTVKTVDDHGASDTASFKVNLDGANDKPLLDVSDVYMTQSYGNYHWTHYFTFHDLKGSDVDAAGNSTYTLKVTAQDGDLYIADNQNGYNYSTGLWVSGEGSHTLNVTGSLNQINAALNGWQDGLTYRTGGNENGVEKITAVLTDTTSGNGGSDTVNFIFKQGGYGGATMTGTNQDDVFFGSYGQDQFVFAAHSGQDTIINFTHGVDKIDFHSLTSIDTSALEALLNGADHTGGNTLLHLNGATDTLLIKGVTSLNVSDFILHT